MADELTLPLFPLRTVLFPGMPLPLHIFEPRYREMLQRCLAGDRCFGVALIKRGVEVGGPAVPHAVGTVARVVEVEALPDGRFEILTLGEDRFQVLAVSDDRPYLVGRVRTIHDADPLDDALVQLADAVAVAFRDLVAQLQRLAGEPSAPPELPDNPRQVSFAVASALQLPLPEKQSLLELTSTAERLRRLMAAIRRETGLLHLVRESQRDLPSIGPFSTN